ncbi:MAG: DUF1707 domain-containing protein, partial [Dehalococcoidia bacterium]
MTLQHRPDDERLIGDADRAAAEAQLREACVDGRLTLAEFSDRMDAALIARTAGQLRAATRDLPAVPIAARSAPISAIRAVLGEKKRTGRWRAEGALDVVAVMGSCAIDLRNAEIIGDELILNVRSVMAEVKIYVPAGVPIVMEETTILGSSKDLRADDPTPLHAPMIRIRGYGVMSNVEVTH